MQVNINKMEHGIMQIKYRHHASSVFRHVPWYYPSVILTTWIWRIILCKFNINNMEHGII